jgi:GNAT superfamily N-acetyltransferase
MEVTIRAACPADVVAIVALVESAYRGDSSRQGWTTEADLLDGQRTDAEEIASLVGGGAHGTTTILVAEAPAVAGAGRGELVACCCVEGGEAGAAHFGLFAVRPALQGAGIGRRLLEAAERHGVERLGASVMQMHVIRQRAELIAWYGRLGYQPTGETAPFPYGNERFGLPRRDDLEFIVLERQLGTGTTPAAAVAATTAAAVATGATGATGSAGGAGAAGDPAG